MTIIVHGIPQSTATRRVLNILKELNVPYELKPVSFATKEHKSEAYLVHHPFGQIPYIQDGDVELYESRAIVRYLAAKFGDGKLLPLPVAGDAASLKRYGEFEQAASVEFNNFDPVASGILTERVRKPAAGLQTDEARAAEFEAKLEANLKVYDLILSKQKYLAGDELTVADLFHLPYGTALIERAGFKGLTVNAPPNVARWWKDITSRESWVSIS